MDKEMQSALRIQALEHDNAMAKIRKQITSVLQYELLIAIEMASCDEWDVSPDRVLRLLQDADKRLNAIIDGVQND